MSSGSFQGFMDGSIKYYDSSRQHLKIVQCLGPLITKLEELSLIPLTVLIALVEIPEFGEHLTIQFLRLTVSYKCQPIYLRRFTRAFLVFGVNQENQEIRRLGESTIPLCNSNGGKLLLRPSSSYHKLLGRVASRILSNILSKIHDGVLLRKQPTASRQTFALMKTSGTPLSSLSSEDVFKTSSRRFPDIFKASCKGIFKTFSKLIIKLNCYC